MTDTNFRPAHSTGYGAGAGPAAPNLSPQHPRGDGRSRETSWESDRLTGDDQGFMDEASELAGDALRAGRDYYEQGSRRVSDWASDHPNQLWAAIAIAGAFALWMAYRPAFSNRSNADPSRDRHRRLPRPSRRAAFMESGAAAAKGRRGN